MADKKKEEKKEESSWFSGMLGNAEKAIKWRKKKLEEAEKEAMGENRPKYSEKWVE